MFNLENQLNEVKSCTNHPDENTSADSNQILTIDLYNNHPEDAEIYEMGKDCVLSLCEGMPL